MRRLAVAIGTVVVVLAIAVLIRNTHKANARIAELERLCAELREQIPQTPAGHAAVETQPGIAPDARPLGGEESTAASTLAAQAELERRLVEVRALQSNASALVQALVATREAPEAPEIPEQLDRARASMEVYEKHLDEARQKSAELSAKAKELLINLNVPRDVASLDSNKALAAVDLQHYWPYFEARNEVEMQNILVERLRLRMLQERVETEVLEAQRKKLK